MLPYHPQYDALMNLTFILCNNVIPVIFLANSDSRPPSTDDRWHNPQNSVRCNQGLAFLPRLDLAVLYRQKIPLDDQSALRFRSATAAINNLHTSFNLSESFRADR